MRTMFGERRGAEDVAPYKVIVCRRDPLAGEGRICLQMSTPEISFSPLISRATNGRPYEKRCSTVGEGRICLQMSTPANIICYVDIAGGTPQAA